MGRVVLAGDDQRALQGRLESHALFAWLYQLARDSLYLIAVRDGEVGNGRVLLPADTLIYVSSLRALELVN